MASVSVMVASIVAVVALAWFLQPQPLLPEARAALASTPAVTFTDSKGWLEFSPAAGGATTGLIFYPGGKVEPAAYARSAQAIAAAGYLVVVPPMPLNLAVLAPDRATEIMAAYPEIESWAVGGHSLGGAMAGRFAAEHPDIVDGLVLWAAYPDGDLSAQSIEALTTYGTLDSGAARFIAPETRARLPSDARLAPIEGGNHGQMGDYTGQPNDPDAAISRDDQQAAAQAATRDLLSRVEGAGG